MKKDHQKNKKNADNRKAIEINSLLHKVNVGVNSDNVFVFSSPLTVIDFAKSVNHPASEIIRYFLIKGQMLNINSLLTEEQIGELCLNFGLDFKKEDEVTEENIFDHIKVNPAGAKYIKRAPIVTIMGHVDHGKTSLLDVIRNTHVAAKEAGGITQHIGAYQIKYNNQPVTFIDTPGHETFSEMRARGAEITDIIVLVVAADDGVMPQTIEAIDHAKSSKAKLIVFINKMDKQGANVDKVLSQLADHDVLVEDWGGDVMCVKGSALKKQGINELLESIFLLADLDDHQAVVNSLPIGVVLESKLDKGLGPQVSIIVQQGTLRKGDYIVCQCTTGRVRTIKNENGENMDEVLPSTPAIISGLDSLPNPGDHFIALRDEKLAKSIALKLIKKQINEERLYELSNKNQEDTSDKKVTNIILRADANGSIEAIKNLFSKINIDGTSLKIIRSAIGSISESDVKLAKASKALIIGFNVRPSKLVRDLANNIGVKILFQNVVYALKDQIEHILIGSLDPVYEENTIGEASVKQIFKASSVGTIAGCVVISGKVVRNAKARVIRDGIVIYTSYIASLKHLKDDVKEVSEGKECGLTIAGFNDIKDGDSIECFIEQQVDLEKKLGGQASEKKN